MKIKIAILLICISIFRDSESQVLKINNGISYSSFTHKNIEILNSKITSYSLTLGCEYLKKQYFELSSEIGYIQKGGREHDFIIFDNNNNNIRYINIDEKNNYLSINTTARFKYIIYNNYIYIGIGPKIDFLLSDKELIHYDYILDRVSLGFKSEFGFTQNLNKKINVGLNFTHLGNIGKIAKSEYSNLYNTYYSISFCFGYVL
ncbi:MAG: hypothetical protein LBL58_02690 [Tannerellaceae bacterium]|jgi:hypothetical protein|nr:hypothetical protein [Tannerellaceae bacterium]